MLITTYSALAACAALVGSLVGAANVRVITQELRSDLSGRWRLNQELSENAQAKVDRMQSSQGHGPGRHGFGGLFRRLFGGGDMEEARGLILNAPASFTLTQDGDRIVLTGSDGRVRTLTANGRKEKVNGRDVQTKWDKQRLVSENLRGRRESYRELRALDQRAAANRHDQDGHAWTRRQRPPRVRR